MFYRKFDTTQIDKLRLNRAPLVELQFGLATNSIEEEMQPLKWSVHNYRRDPMEVGSGQTCIKSLETVPNLLSSTLQRIGFRVALMMLSSFPSKSPYG